MSHTSRVIRCLWQMQNESWTSKKRIGLWPKEAVRISDKRNSADEIPTLGNWLLIYDEFLSWYTSLYTVVYSKIHNIGSEDIAEAKVSTLLLGAVISHSFAIRKLVLSGFDLAAKQVLRSLCEYNDLMLLIAVDPGIANEFLGTDIQERSDAFWRKYFRKGKARRQFYQYAQRNDAAHPEIIDWRKQEDSILSMSAHPSMLASFVSIAPPGCDESSPWMGFFGGLKPDPLLYNHGTQ
jgi:hypothetical protein